MKYPQHFDMMGHVTPGADLQALASLTDSLGFFNPLRIVEVGSWAGLSTYAFLQRSDTQVFCVDHWGGNLRDDSELPDSRGVRFEKFAGTAAFQTFCRNMGDHLLTRVVPCVGSSLHWAAIWPWQADLIFLDAEHDYLSVRNDIEAWWPHVREGGILCGHDYGVFPGVGQAVHEIFGVPHEAGRCIWYIRK